jgi:DHA3 family tetracycline resistance protein-like MFS transporter
LDDFYSLLKEKATRLSREDFIAWLKHPVLLLEFPDEYVSDLTGGTPLAAIESTVLFQGGSTVGQSADGDSDANETRAARVLARDGRALEPSDELSIGRSSDCDIVIEHHSISKVHAHITREANGSFVIRDAGSRNGITINGARVESHQSAKLKPDDVVRVGGVMLRLAYPRPLHELLNNKAPPRSTLARLRDRTFAKFWAGQGLALMADSLYRLVITWWIVMNTGSGQALSLIAVFQIVPMMLTLVRGGTLVDRMARSQVLLLSIALKAVALAFVAVMLRKHALGMPHLYAVAVVLGVADALFTPALAAIVPELVRRDDLRGANALVTLSSHVANGVGPALGTVLVSLGGHALAMAVIVTFYGVASLFVIRLPAVKPTRGPHEHREAAGGGAGEAVKFMFHEPRLWMTSLTFAICGSFGFVTVTVLLPLLLKTEISYLGGVQSVYWVGALLGTLWMGRTVFKRELAGYAAAPVVALCFAAAGLPITVFGIAAVWFVRGFANNVLSLTWVGTMQRLVPRDMLGRVASIDAFIGATLLLGTFVATGALVDVVTTEALFVMIGAGALIMPIAAYSSRRFRQLA